MGRCIADCTKDRLILNIADTKKSIVFSAKIRKGLIVIEHVHVLSWPIRHVSPLDKKIHSEHMNLSQIQISCDDFSLEYWSSLWMVFWFQIVGTYQFVRCDNRRLLQEKNKRKSEQRRDKGEREGGSSIDYIYKELE